MIRKDLRETGLTKQDAQDRVKWRSKIRGKVGLESRYNKLFRRIKGKLANPGLPGKQP